MNDPFKDFREIQEFILANPEKFQPQEDGGNRRFYLQENGISVAYVIFKYFWGGFKVIYNDDYRREILFKDNNVASNLSQFKTICGL